MNNITPSTAYWRSVADMIRHAPVEMNDDDAFEIVHQLLMRNEHGDVDAKPTKAYGLQGMLGRAVSEWIRRRHE